MIRDMAEGDLFADERALLDRCRAALSGADPTAPLHQPLDELLTAHARLLRRFRQTVRLSDRSHSQLREMHERLRGAQEELARAASSTGDLLDDPVSWARRAADGILAALRARSLDVWLLEQGVLTAIGAAAGPPPDLARLEAIGGSAPGPRPGEWLVAVRGVSGALRGALAVDSARPLDETQRGLLTTLAGHLGTALDLRHARGRLQRAEADARAQRERLKEQAVDLAGVCPACSGCFEAAEPDALCPVDGFLLDSNVALPLVVADRYRLEAQLGIGGMGAVYRAHDRRLGRPVALKVLRDLDADAEQRARFEREARTIARLRHPGIVTLYDQGELDGGVLFLVMELLAGNNLAVLIERDGRGSPAQVAALLRQAGSALAAAHAAGIVHRDLKPGNVVLDQQGLHFKLVDFGIARPLAGAGLTETGLVLGTPGFMAPEQAMGRPVDGRTDLYGLAAVAWAALTARPLFAIRNSAQAAYAAVLIPAPRPSSVLALASPRLDQAFARALAKLPEQRPSDVAAWAEEAATEVERLPPAPGWRDQPAPGGPEQDATQRLLR
jgi:serine/threonine-protein kinase